MVQAWNFVNQLEGTAKKTSIDAAIEPYFGSASTSAADSFDNASASVSGVARGEPVANANFAPSSSSSACLPEITKDDLRLILFSFTTS